MSEVTIRARDSAEAMDKVVKKLGKDALILETRTVDGLVEIRACKPEDQTPPEPTKKTVGRTSFAQAHSAEDFRKMFEKRLSASEEPVPSASAKAHAQTAPEWTQEPAVAPDRAPRALAQPVTNPRQALTPDPFDASGGWPALSDVFAHRLREDLVQLQSGNLRDGFLGQVMRLHDPLGAAQVLRHPRILVTGPSLADSVDVALRLYVNQAEHDDTRRPELVFCTTQSRTDGATFEAKARLVGEMIRYATPDTLDIAQRAQAMHQIIVVPPHVPLDVSHGEYAAVIAIPMGLHPRRLAQMLPQWGAFDAHLALTQLDHWAPSAEELAVCVAHRLTISFAAYGSSILDPFRVITPQDIASWAETWLCDLAPTLGGRAPATSDGPTAEPPQSDHRAPPSAAAQPNAAGAAHRFDRISYIAHTQDEGSTS